MKILFFIDGLGAGGKERRLNELLKKLLLVPGIDFELVLMSREIHYTNILESKIPIHFLIRKSKKDISIFRKFYQICKAYQPDIIHCWNSMAAIYSVPAAKLLGIKLVNGMVADAPEQQNIGNKSWLRAKLTFPFSDIVVGNSQAGINAYHAPKKKSIVIHNGFDFIRTKNIESSATIKKDLNIGSEFIIGMVASFSPKKDYKTYLEAAQILLNKRNDVVFLLVGQNTDSIILKNLVDIKKIRHFRFLGKKTNIESIVNAMDICVLATFTEGISNAIMEYMALGKPVIATSGGGTNEIVEDSESGFLVKSSNAEAMAAKIELLLNNAEIREKMGKSGKERVRDLFSLDKMINEYLLVYKKIVAESEIL